MRSEVVATSCGPVRGKIDDRISVFWRIPFACAPLGALRFAAPEPMEASRTVIDAKCPPPAPLQIAGRVLGSRPVHEVNEDCLYLNVFTPRADNAERPVMIWIFGGGFVNGQGADPLFDGTHLAMLGDVVVVSLNYRLGAFGFLDLADAPGTCANTGLLDQVAALRWVQENIAGFGGDPNNITVFGESAGAMSICDLLAMPAARGLFQRAIAQSGAASSVQSRAQAQLSARRLCEALDLEPCNVDALRRVEARRILDAQSELLTQARRERSGMSFRPVVDGNVLPADPLDAARNGAGRDVPLLIGTNLDEQRLYFNPRRKVEWDDLTAYLVTRLTPLSNTPGELAREAVETYRSSRESRGERHDAAAIWCAIETDLAFRRPATALAEARGTNTWMYLFCWRSPALRGWLGASHAVELPFVFGNLHVKGMARFAGTGSAAESLAQVMMVSWVQFARTGDPQTEALEHWSPYTQRTRVTALFDVESSVEAAPYENERRVWSALTV